MADSFQNEVPKARINLKLDLHTGGASKKMELPLKLLVAGDFSNGQESAQISEREKVNITKNNFDSVLSEYSPKLNLTVKNTLSDDGGEENVQLTFQSMKDFTPEQVAAQIYVLDLLVEGGAFDISGIVLRYGNRAVKFMPIFLYGQGVAGCVEVTFFSGYSAISQGRLFMRVGSVYDWIFTPPDTSPQSGKLFDEGVFFDLILALLS